MITDFLAERAELLEEGNFLEELLGEMSTDEWVAARDLRDRKDTVYRRYLALLPEVTLARSPDTGDVVRFHMDTGGLDGWYWRYEAAERMYPEPMPAGWLAMNGAMRLAEPVEFTPFQVVPGPGVPYVVPELLKARNVRAVVSEVRVGRHTGWAVTYFGRTPRDVQMPNTWGSNAYQVDDDIGVWNLRIEHVSDYDFDLAKWLRAGRLLWIAPGDTSAVLREGTDGCPYLDLPGERRIAYVHNGEVEYGG